FIFFIACSRKISPAAENNTSINTKTFEAKPQWSDEFNYQGKPDSAKWDYDLGGGGWGNNELQHYTNDINNAKVEGGHLYITAIKEKTGERDYSSARLISKNKGDF